MFLSFEEGLFLNKAKIMYKIAKNIIPPYICDLFQRRSDSIMNTTLRSVSDENFVTPRPNLSIFKESLSYSGPVIWNSIPLEYKEFFFIEIFCGECITMDESVVNQESSYLHLKYASTTNNQVK